MSCISVEQSQAVAVRRHRVLLREVGNKQHLSHCDAINWVNSNPFLLRSGTTTGTLPLASQKAAGGKRSRRSAFPATSTLSLNFVRHLPFHHGHLALRSRSLASGTLTMRKKFASKTAPKTRRPLAAAPSNRGILFMKLPRNAASTSFPGPPLPPVRSSLYCKTPPARGSGTSTGPRKR